VAERDPWFDRMRSRFRLEHGLPPGGMFMFVGVGIGSAMLVLGLRRR
jgi:hypothetical protein